MAELYSGSYMLFLCRYRLSSPHLENDWKLRDEQRLPSHFRSFGRPSDQPETRHAQGRRPGAKSNRTDRPEQSAEKQKLPPPREAISRFHDNRIDAIRASARRCAARGSARRAAPPPPIEVNQVAMICWQG
ncbi:hypothetical protein GVO57_01770 [Sphingomonas changnyeongensis]|uniref:Uncharacterized protein n=1 Tax=Sphingomonas changnyeongensis TaxID=2698679 RepID=A0A7Z2NUA0_9SPHN|nr:hypothetical protein [Sphingomonas changnyeongensis]QHL89782.1 hypothetical protein GVO57_01770 [Sphingomonas changnyeongensis]